MEQCSITTTQIDPKSRLMWTTVTEGPVKKDLRGADLTYADWRDSDLTDADLRAASIAPGGSQWNGEDRREVAALHLLDSNGAYSTY